MARYTRHLFLLLILGSTISHADTFLIKWLNGYFIQQQYKLFCNGCLLKFSRRVYGLKIWTSIKHHYAFCTETTFLYQDNSKTFLFTIYTRVSGRVAQCCWIVEQAFGELNILSWVELRVGRKYVFMIISGINVSSLLVLVNEQCVTAVFHLNNHPCKYYIYR